MVTLIGDYIGTTVRDLFPHSLLSTREMRVVQSRCRGVKNFRSVHKTAVFEHLILHPGAPNSQT